jgi:DNA-binding protein H-NS
MPSKLSDLIAKKAELEQQIIALQREEKSSAIAQVKSLMAQHGLSLADLNARAPGPQATVKGKKAAAGTKSKAGTKVAPKYRDPSTGDTWSGRGLHPRWLKQAMSRGAKLTDFLIA